MIQKRCLQLLVSRFTRYLLDLHLLEDMCVKQLGHCIESLLSRIQLRRDGIYNIPRLYFSVDTGKESRKHCESKN